MKVKTYLLAIDPGTFASGWVLMEMETCRPVGCGKTDNSELLSQIGEGELWAPQAVIEMMTSYGARVGRETLETCVWIGRFIQELVRQGTGTRTMYRRDVKLELIGSPRAKDKDLRQLMQDRFAYGVPNLGKGTKAEPGWFYGFHADVWQAYALGVAWLDKVKREERA